jgi:protein-tyrosine phosphatase
MVARGEHMEYFEIVPNKLYQSSLPGHWDDLLPLGANVSVNLSDMSVPRTPPGWMSIRWEIEDGDLPDLSMLSTIADAVVALINAGRAVTVNCIAGVNRASLLTGLVVYRLGIAKGDDIVTYMRLKRPGALANATFAAYLSGLK